MPVIPATWEAEAGESLEPGEVVVSRDRSIACQPGKQEQNTISKTKGALVPPFALPIHTAFRIIVDFLKGKMSR